MRDNRPTPDLVGLLATHGRALRRLAGAYARSAGEQEDLYQEMLLQLWRGLPGFKGDAAPGTWLYRVALNTALTWRRQAGRRPATEPAEREPAAGSATGGRSEAAILDEFLGSLGPADRSVLLLYMEGLPYGEIAEVTGMKAGAVGVRLHRIKQLYTERYVGR